MFPASQAAKKYLDECWTQVRRNGSEVRISFFCVRIGRKRSGAGGAEKRPAPFEKAGEAYALATPERRAASATAAATAADTFLSSALGSRFDTESSPSGM